MNHDATPPVICCRVSGVQIWKCWIVWDGRRWKKDESGKLVLRVASEFAKRLWTALPQIAQDSDGKEFAPRCAFIRRFNNTIGLKAILDVAVAHDRVLISHKDLNRNPMLLNLTNGTYDLDDGTLREHDPADLNTQMADVAFDPDATCPKWDETFSLIFGDDDDLIRYVRQVFGYSLNGVVADAILPIAYGRGCNGKSTVWNTVFDLMGDYSTVASETLLLGFKDAHPTEKAAQYQKRIVAISEPPENVQLKESRMKEMTGGDVITARGMYENFWDFRPTHLFLLSTNHLPRVSGTDEGVWRRLMPIPFTTDLRDKVQPIPNFHRWLVENEAAGILNWLLAGHRDWQEHRFCVPAAVEMAAGKYRSSQDQLGSFIDECC